MLPQARIECPLRIKLQDPTPRSSLSKAPLNPAVAGVSPASSPTPSSASLRRQFLRPFGANNEQLPERLQSALRRIVQQFSTESESTRRQEIRRIKQAHQFWRGLQYLWWSERDQNWHLPFEQKLTDGSSIEDLPRYEFVTNIYQAFGLSIVSVLSQDVPRVRFFPSSAQAEEDVSAAKAATEVAQLVERNNRIGNLIVDEAFNLWTDGKVGAYVRFVVDGQRFGFHPETEIAAREVKIGEDVYVCPDCGEETPAALRSAGLRPAVPSTDDQNSAPDPALHKQRDATSMMARPRQVYRATTQCRTQRQPRSPRQLDRCNMSAAQVPARSSDRIATVPPAAHSSPPKISSPLKPSPCLPSKRASASPTARK